MILIVGLGNPGKQYEKTRHNLGFHLLDALAVRWGLSFKKESKFQGEIASGVFAQQKIYLLKPDTYMNLSGHSVRKVVDYFDINEVLVVCDDADLPFGNLRLLEKGGTGGHNGLKSIKETLGTDQYKRLRIGVGSGGENDLSDHVLGKFQKKECSELPEIFDRGVIAIEEWLQVGINEAMKLANSETK